VLSLLTSFDFGCTETRSLIGKWMRRNLYFILSI
jgi:hypothetical protein